MTDFTKKTTDDVHHDIDSLLQDNPEELQKVRNHRQFMKDITENKIQSPNNEVQVMGVKSVNLNHILKKNILERSIFTVDELCEMFLAMTIEKLIKYQKKKRPLDFNLWWLILLVIGAPAVILIMITLFGGG